MNKILQCHLQQHFGGTDKVTENLSKLLSVISDSYDTYEKDRKTIERSIELSSKDLIELNSDIKKEKEELKKAHNDLQQAPGDINKIIDSSLDVICAVDAKGSSIKVSTASEAVWGYKPEEVIANMAGIRVKQRNNFLFHHSI